MSQAAMHQEDLPSRRVDEVVTVLMMPMLDSVEGKRRHRLLQATADLRDCIEAVGERLMTDEERAMLAFERQFFGPEGAVARVASAWVLLLVLPVYLADTRWQGTEDEDRRVRMRLGVRLARATSRLPELDGFDVSRALADVMRGWRVASRRFRRERADRLFALLPPEQRVAIEEKLAQIGLGRAADTTSSSP